MFDEVDQQATPKEGVKKEPEDIFAEIEGDAMNNMPRGNAPKPELSVSGSTGPNLLMKILLGFVALAVLGAIVGGGVYYFSNKGKEANENLGNVTTSEVENVLETETAVSSNENDLPSRVEEETTPTDFDTDQDGLADSFELENGTDLNNPDSDSDGLSDYQEVIVYKTNPLNPDTDGDSFTDGQEVNNGYNPLGEGTLSL